MTTMRRNVERENGGRVRSRGGCGEGPGSSSRDGWGSRLAVLAAATALLIPLVGCDDDDNGTGPGETATVQAVMTDGGGDGGAAVAARDPAARGSVSGSADVDGSFSGEAQVQISADGQTWTNLGSMQSVNVALESGEEATIHASAQVPAQSYTRVRLVMRDARATVLAGSTIGAGPISADVTVEIAGGSEFTIEKQASVGAQSGTSTTLVFDLNSQAWLGQATVDAGAATAAQVSGATSVRVR